MPRYIDADALEKEGWSLHRTIRVDKNTDEYQTKPLRKVPTIEPRCETCEAFNKTRLLIPQPQRKKGKWIERESGTEDKEYGFETVIVCSCCDFPATTFYSEDCESRTQIRTDFCPNCGAEMTEDE